VRWAALAALCVAAGGCPLPQPLPDVQRTPGQRVTPPRILAETALPASAVVTVGTTCAGSVLRFDAQLADENGDEGVEARWFVDYEPTPSRSGFVAVEFAPPSGNPADPVRSLAGYSYPVQAVPAGQRDLIELVVSNGFYPTVSEPLDVAQPRRTAQPGFEVQVFRWIVEYVAGAPCP
jgi:hypothetical protein